MIRKFGSRQNFERVKISQDLIGRGAEVGLDRTSGYTQEALTARRQSCTVESHRLVLWVTAMFGTGKSEELYEVLNRRHFLESGVLADRELLVSSCLEVLGYEKETEIREFLSSEKMKQEVMNILTEIENVGIKGIPTLVANGSLVWVTSGASRERELIVFLGNVVGAIERGDETLGERMFGMAAGDRNGC